MKWLCALAVVVAPLAAAAQTIQDVAPRPPPLPPEPGCELWRGTSSGNDPSVEIEVRICRSGDTFTGAFQWSSTRSGWNRRSIEGRVSDGGATVTMRDLAILEQRPQPGWMFCTVDRYSLTRTGDTLAGRYDSEACTDHGTLQLRLVGTEPAPPPPATPPPTMPPPPPPAARSGCGCSTSPSAVTPVGLLGALAVTLPFLRRRSIW